MATFLRNFAAPFQRSPLLEGKGSIVRGGNVALAIVTTNNKKNIALSHVSLALKYVSFGPA